jgi:hypothetical protein
MTRRLRKLILILAAAGLILRLRQYLACPSYWYDEAYLLLNIFHKSYLELLGPLSDDQAAPPLFLWLLRGLYRIAGGSEWCMRLPALLASVGGVLLMASLSRRVVGRRGWPWAVAFCALGHHAIAHAAEVKPYAFDPLMSEAILWATIACRGQTGRRWPGIALCALALFAPWLSYPSVFALGGASLSLLLHSHRCAAARKRHGFLLAWIVGGLSILSTFTLWYIVVRRQSTYSLQEFWAAGFLDLSSVWAAATWTGRCLNEIGNYGTREMGLPLLILATIGAISWRHRRDRLALLLGPLLLALLASALRLYPLAGRLLFFLTPYFWLLAARGIGTLTRRLPARWTSLGWIAPAILLVPALAWSGRLLVEVTPRCQFREAFAFVEQKRQRGEILWVSHPQVYAVYHGGSPDLSGYSPPELVEQTARTTRLWMICAVAGSRERYTAAETVARVKAAAGSPLLRRRFRGLEVVLYAANTEYINRSGKTLPER